MNDLLSRLRPPPGARASGRRRRGRGIGSGLGKTCGRGTKGDKARGSAPRPGFEGGQMPLHRRVPKRGFHPPRSIRYNVVNLRDLARFDAGATVDPDALRAVRLVRRVGPVKILAFGTLDRPLTVKAHAFSQAAREAIASAGGTVELLMGPRRPREEAPGSAKKRGAQG